MDYMKKKPHEGAFILPCRNCGSNPRMSCSISCIEITIICINRHDGFTLQDLVSYNHNKHNESNGECNRDGYDFNMSFNHGIEGPTTDESVLVAREEHKAFGLCVN